MSNKLLNNIFKLYKQAQVAKKAEDNKDLQTIFEESLKGKEPVIETANGILYFQPKGDQIIFGSATNVGISQDYVFDYDYDYSFDQNIQEMIMEVLEQENNKIEASKKIKLTKKAKEYSISDYLSHFNDVQQYVLTENKGDLGKAVEDLLGFASSEYDKAKFPREYVYKLVKKYIDDTIKFQERINHPIKEEYIVKAKELLNKYKTKNKIANKISTLTKKAGYSNNPNYFGDWFGKGQIDFSQIINPNDSGDVWMVKLWGGKGYILDVYLVKADDYYDAVDKVFEWSYENEGANKIVFDRENLEEEALEYFKDEPDMFGKELEEEDFIDRFLEEYYVANEDYSLFAREENFFADKVPEEYLKGNKQSSKTKAVAKQAENKEIVVTYEGTNGKEYIVKAPNGLYFNEYVDTDTQHSRGAGPFETLEKAKEMFKKHRPSAKEIVATKKQAGIPEQYQNNAIVKRIEEMLAKMDMNIKSIEGRGLDYKKVNTDGMLPGTSSFSGKSFNEILKKITDYYETSRYNKKATKKQAILQVSENGLGYVLPNGKVVYPGDEALLQTELRTNKKILEKDIKELERLEKIIKSYPNINFDKNPDSVKFQIPRIKKGIEYLQLFNETIEDILKAFQNKKMGKQATIKHENGVYNVYSESGKCLGKGYKTKEEAQKRLKQVEYFKHKKASKEDTYEEWGVLCNDLDEEWFESEEDAKEFFYEVKNKVDQVVHKVYDVSNEEPEEIQVDVLYDKDRGINKITSNKKSFRDVVISKIAEKKTTDDIISLLEKKYQDALFSAWDNGEGNIEDTIYSILISEKIETNDKQVEEIADYFNVYFM